MRRLTLIVMATSLLILGTAGMGQLQPLIEVVDEPAKPPSAGPGPQRPSLEETSGRSGINLLINGSFEAGPSVWKLEAGSTAIEGWTVMRGSIDRASTQWCKSSDGLFSLDLDGEAAFGGVSQTFATTPGQVYLVSFDIAGNPEGPPEVKKMRVQAAGQSADFSFKISGRNRGNRPYILGWQRHTWCFTATDSKTAIEFSSLDTVGGHHGPMLDNVSVSAHILSNGASVGVLATVHSLHGEHLVGNVVAIEAGKLILTGPQFKGRVRILVSALDRVSTMSQTIKSDGPDRVQLTNGDYLGGKIETITEDSLVLESQAAGVLSVPRELVRSIGFSGKQPKDTDKAQAESHIVRFANNDMVSATSVSVVEGVLMAQTAYGQLRCPVEKVANIVLASKGQEQPRRNPGDVLVETAASCVTLQFDKVTDEYLLGRAEHLGQVKVARSAVRSIRFNIYK